jgi:hypothetical protein
VTEHAAPVAHRPRRRLVVAAVLVALVSGVGGVGGTAVAAEDVVEPVRSETTLVVSPGERTAPGVELTLTATVVERDTGDPVVGEPLRFLVDDTVLAGTDLDGSGRAVATVTPPQGAHVLVATLVQTEDDPYASSEAVVHQSVLPETCVDAAQPGTGAVVRHAYIVGLGRCPDPTGFAFWVDRIGNPVVPGPAVGAPARTAEAIEVVVDDAYRRILGRRADPMGRAVWAAKLRAGWATSQLWAALAASPELVGAATGTDALVDLVFARIVGRPIDPAAQTYWRDRLLADDGALSPTWRALAVTPEVVDGVVVDAYDAALGRSPSAAEAGAARPTIRTRRGDWRPLRPELLGRPEAATYAQRYPDLETDI